MNAPECTQSTAEGYTGEDAGKRPYLAGVGITTLVAQIFLTLGLHEEATGRAMSIGYVQVVFAFIWGAVVFGTIPDMWSIVGAGAIVWCALLIARNW